MIGFGVLTAEEERDADEKLLKKGEWWFYIFETSNYDVTLCRKRLDTGILHLSKYRGKLMEPLDDKIEEYIRRISSNPKYNQLSRKECIKFQKPAKLKAREASQWWLLFALRRNLIRDIRQKIAREIHQSFEAWIEEEGYVF